MKRTDFTYLFKNAVLQGAQKAVLQNSILPDHYTKAQAYRLFGRANIDRWISEGIISLHGTSRKCIDRRKLEHVACTSNRVTYLPVADR